MKLTPTAEVRVPITLDQVRTLVFNCNTMVAYEQATGKFFLRTVSDLLSAAYPDGLDKEIVKSPFEIISKVSMEDLRALLWSALHDYDENDNPVWPLTIAQVGRLINLQSLIPTFKAFLLGQSGNNPTRTEMGESQAEAEQKKNIDSPPITQKTGGESGIVLPADAFA